MKTTELQYCKAWKQLQSFYTFPFANILTTTGIFDEEFDIIKTELKAIKQQIRKFIQNIKTYQWAKIAFYCQQLQIK